MIDNQSNEPTEAQVEAAAKIIRRASLETTANPGDFWSDCYESEQEAWRNAARAALVAAARAAQGAAPQAESEQPWNDPSDPNSPQFDSPWGKAAALIQSIRCAQWDMLERRDQEDVRDEINGLVDRLDELATTMLAAPVLPPSDVDEDALADVIRKLRFDDAGCRADGIDCTESVSDHADAIARAVAEWLKGQER